MRRLWRSDRLQVWGFIALILFVGVAYMLHRLHAGIVNFWDDGTDWLKAHRFAVGVLAGVAACLIVAWWI